MTALALVACLGHPECEARESASAHLPFWVTRQEAGRLWREETDDPEKKERLFRVYRVLTAREVNHLLPPSRPWWPDADAIWKDRQTGELYGEYDEARQTMQNNTPDGRNGFPVYHDFRAYTARRLTTMALETGDLFWPSVFILVGHAGEAYWTAGQVSVDPEKLRQYPYLLREGAPCRP